MNTLFVGKSPRSINFCKNHFHDCWEIVIPISGEGTVKTDGQELVFEKDSLYIMPPQLTHLTFSEKGFEDIFIHIKDLPFKRDKITIIYGVKSLPQLGELIYDLYLKKDAFAPLDTAVKLLSELCFSISKESVDSSVARKIKDFLTENLANSEINMKTLEATFKYDKDYIRKLFKEEYQKTPMEYLDNLRINYAKELLVKMPVYSISQISEMCGFSDPLYFSRFFKKHTSLSPKNYIKTAK